MYFLLLKLTTNQLNMTINTIPKKVKYHSWRYYYDGDQIEEKYLPDKGFFLEMANDQMEKGKK